MALMNGESKSRDDLPREMSLILIADILQLLKERLQKMLRRLGRRRRGQNPPVLMTVLSQNTKM